MVANLAIIQGSSRGIGLGFSRYILSHTDLNLIATTSQDPQQTRRSILSGLSSNLDSHHHRLTTLRLDVTREETIEQVAGLIKHRFGRSLRLLINVSGWLIPEKSIQRINLEDMKRSFEINTFGHLLTYKHFVPLLPPKSKSSTTSSQHHGLSTTSSQHHGLEQDPAKGLIKPNLHVLASLSARVGSIGDNGLGGWYSYRASKTALNQIIVTLQRELDHTRSLAPTITLALHPGTVAGTDLSKDFVSLDQIGKKQGVHDVHRAVQQLCDVIAQLDETDGARFLDYMGQPIVW